MDGIKNEKRRAKRMDLQANLLLREIGQSASKGVVRIDVLDLSQTGIGFICDSELNIGTTYEADIIIWTGDIIHAFIEIVRKSGEHGGFIYGGVFIGMPESDWCRIRVYETYKDYGLN